MGGSMCGGVISMTKSVTTIASTPSEKASTRFVSVPPMLGPVYKLIDA
jgi:hypothetical protein